LLGASGPALGSPSSSPKAVSIVVKASDRNGNPAYVGEDAVAVRLSSGAPAAEYRANAAGVLSVPRGKYVIGVSIISPATLPATSDSFTLTARVVKAEKKMTVSFSARGGRLLTLGLTGSGAQERVASAGLCYGSGSSSIGMVSSSSSVENGATSLYAVPFSYKGLDFAYSSNWEDAAGSMYATSGVHAGGIPAHPEYTFRADDLARVILQARSGAAAGSEGSWYIRQFGCQLGGLTGTSPVALPSQTTMHVSPGQWLIGFFPADQTGQSGTQVPVSLKAGKSYLQVLDGAVVGPARGSVPYIAHGSLTMPLNALFSGSDGGAECCATGTIELNSRGQVIKGVTFTVPKNTTFGTRLRRAGWYGLNISASRVAPPPGITAAALSTKVTVAWRFSVSRGDLRSAGIGLPVSLATFVPAGLAINNEAAAKSLTRVRIYVRQGRAGHAFRLKTVCLEISFNDGTTWQNVRLTARRGYWLADIHNPASGFASLRSIVTDMSRDRSVETIYRAYGIS
jgi:hypothetical protein